MSKLLGQVAAVLTFAAMSASFHPVALAQSTVDQDFQIVQRWYALQLESARATDAAMTQISACLEQRETALSQRITELETVIGGLATEEAKQTSAVAALSGALTQLESNLKDAERQSAKANQDLQNLPGRAGYEKWKRSCDSKSPDWSIYVCSYGNRDAFSEVAKAEAELPGLIRRVEIARDTLNGESAKLAENQRLLGVARQDLAKTKTEKLGRNLEVADVKKWQFEVRELIPPIRSVVNRLDSSLARSRKVDVEDERRITMLQMKAIAEDIVRSLTQANSHVAHYQTVLPQGWDSSCKRG